MRFAISTVLAVLLAAVFTSAQAAEPSANLGTYHGNANRSGMFVVPGLTPTAAATLHQDTKFAGKVTGNVYAQPLYWRPPGALHGLVVVATSSNDVFALDATTGSVVWHTALGSPVSKASLPCGDIDPLGVTGTPSIGIGGVVYMDAMVAQPSGPRHMLFALSMLTGTVQTGYPIDIATALKALGITFQPSIQNQRSALTIVNGKLYIPYSGLAGDCEAYHGWVVGADLTAGKLIGAWATRAPLGGIWGQSGVSYDGQSLFVATGNTRHTTTWGDGEAVIRLPPNLSHSSNTDDYFTPRDWLTLDNEDHDLGGTGPIPLDAPSASGTQSLVLALGKDGHAYLLDRSALGGIGAALVNVQVSTKPIVTAAAVYPVGNSLDIAFRGTCASETGVSVINVSSGSPPKLRSKWCTAVNGGGSPIVTTTDGKTDPIVWFVGAMGDNALHGFSGATGAALYTSLALSGLHHFQTILVAERRLYVAGDNQVYAFSFSQ